MNDPADTAAAPSLLDRLAEGSLSRGGSAERARLRPLLPLPSSRAMALIDDTDTESPADDAPARIGPQATPAASSVAPGVRTGRTADASRDAPASDTRRRADARDEAVSAPPSGRITGRPEIDATATRRAPDHDPGTARRPPSSDVVAATAQRWTAPDSERSAGPRYAIGTDVPRLGIPDERTHDPRPAAVAPPRAGQAPAASPTATATHGTYAVNALRPARSEPSGDRTVPLARPLRIETEPRIEIHIGRVEVRAHTSGSAPAPRAPLASTTHAALATHLGARGRGARS